MSLQNIPFGVYGYGAYLQKLSDELQISRGRLTRVERMKAAGVTVTPSGHDVDECIRVIREKVAARQRAWDRAKAEA